MWPENITEKGPSKENRQSPKEQLYPFDKLHARIQTTVFENKTCLCLRRFLSSFLAPHPRGVPGEGPDCQFPRGIMGFGTDSGPGPRSIGKAEVQNGLVDRRTTPKPPNDNSTQIYLRIVTYRPSGWPEDRF